MAKERSAVTKPQVWMSKNPHNKKGVQIINQRQENLREELSMKSLGIIGGGLVGSALAEAFKDFVKEVKVYDKIRDRATSSRTKTVDSDFVFICVPTPMNPDGSCDITAVTEVLDELRQCKRTIVLRSTVPPGTTSRLSVKYELPQLIYSPEFLKAHEAVLDACNPSRNIIGHTDDPRSISAGDRLQQLYKGRYSKVPTIIMQAIEAELCKLACNSFFATKVSFFNELAQICDSLGCQMNTITDGMIGDRRIADAHRHVPGHDGRRGFGGACLPKDLNSLMTIARECGIEPLVMQAAWQKNLEVRPDVV